MASVLGFWVAYVSQGRSVRLEETELHAAELRRANERIDLLARELNHRVKNLFAIVMSIITATARNEPNSKIAAQKARERVQALSMAHSFTANYDAKHQTSLSELIKVVVRPQILESQTLSSSGPDIAISAELVTPFGMILHELTTNSLKYGAWNGDKGRVELSWRLSTELEPEMLIINWREHLSKERTLQAPEAEGFGSRMIAMSLAQLKAGRTSTWHTDGLETEIAVPIAVLKQHN